jgi:hypothetical protein
VIFHDDEARGFRGCEQITLNAKTAKTAKKNSQEGFLSVLCELALKRRFFTGSAAERAPLS